jgi:hypothetical protein
MKLEDRVKKTVSLFDQNIKLIDGVQLSKEEKTIVELAKMYASDSVAWMKKDDYVTAFSGIEYAHGLLDAILRIKGKDPYESDK